MRYWFSLTVQQFGTDAAICTPIKYSSLILKAKCAVAQHPERPSV